MIKNVQYNAMKTVHFLFPDNEGNLQRNLQTFNVTGKGCTWQ